LRCV